jgi:hypothetical protein
VRGQQGRLLKVGGPSPAGSAGRGRLDVGFDRSRSQAHSCCFVGGLWRAFRLKNFQPAQPGGSAMFRTAMPASMVSSVTVLQGVRAGSGPPFPGGAIRRRRPALVRSARRPGRRPGARPGSGEPRDAPNGSWGQTEVGGKRWSAEADLRLASPATYRCKPRRLGGHLAPLEVLGYNHCSKGRSMLRPLPGRRRESPAGTAPAVRGALPTTNAWRVHQRKNGSCFA